MLDIVKKWFNRYFFEEEALILLLLIVVSLVIVITMGNVLAPIIAAIILAYLIEGMTDRLIKRGMPEGFSVWLTFVVFIGAFFAVMFVLLPLAWQQMSNLFAELPGMVSRLQTVLIVLPEQYPTVFSESQIQQFTQLAATELE